MEDLVLHLRHAPMGEGASNSSIGVLVKLWQPIVDAFIEEYGEPGEYKRRLGDFRRGSCIAWINHLLAESNWPLINQSRSELPWTIVTRIIRFLEGDHPEHQESSQAQVDAALKERADEIHGWLLWNKSAVLEWEARSRERRQ